MALQQIPLPALPTGCAVIAYTGRIATKEILAAEEETKN